MNLETDWEECVPVESGMESWGLGEPFTGILSCIGASGLLVLYRADITKSDLWWSPSTPSLLGYEPAELVPSFDTLQSLVHPDDRSSFLHRMRRLGTGDPAEEGVREYRLRRKDGEYVWACWVTTARQSEETGTTASLDVLRLIDRDEGTERTIRKLNESALSTVLNEIGYPVVLMNAQGIIVQANEAAARFAGGTDAAERFCPFLHGDDGQLLFTGFLEDVIRLGQPASRELQRFDHWWHVHLVPIRDDGERVARILLLAQDVTSIKAEQAAELERQRALTRTLVKEVHHRIKNHLQGLIGLLRRFSHSGLTGDEWADAAIVQIQSIAAMHGILARSGKSSIDFVSLMTEIVSAHRATSLIPVSFSVDLDSESSFELPEDESVPFALVVGELLTNAIKHTTPGSNAQVAGVLSAYGTGIELSITNSPAHLPEGFILSDWAFRRSGLDLVRALLPRERAEFLLEQHGSAVVARLRMSSPGPRAPAHESIQPAGGAPPER
ncbi:MAG TPA: PAS domain-containing protein [Steroidobacteraceae bacterium]|nr:PAS domain-containing protein [Steroidobacteraceae bacterium]